MHAAIEPSTRQAIEALIYEHAWLIDHGQADRLPGLYTEDARVLGIGPDKVGQQAITEWAGQRAAMTERCSANSEGFCAHPGAAPAIPARPCPRRALRAASPA